MFMPEIFSINSSHGGKRTLTIRVLAATMQLQDELHDPAEVLPAVWLIQHQVHAVACVTRT
jgi:hypothetical protein